jgi:hypothetical protein
MKTAMETIFVGKDRLYHVHWLDAAAPQIARSKVWQIARSLVFLLFDDRLNTYAAVVAASASRGGGGSANPPDTASMQRRRASLSEDT